MGNKYPTGEFTGLGKHRNPVEFKRLIGEEFHLEVEDFVAAGEQLNRLVETSQKTGYSKEEFYALIKGTIRQRRFEHDGSFVEALKSVLDDYEK